MAFRTIWSVDLGKSSLKAVLLRREKNTTEILAVDKVDYQTNSNGFGDGDQAKAALSVFRSRNEVSDPLVVAHPGQGTFSRFIKIPAFDEKKLDDMVGFEASQQIPFPLDEVIWDFHIVDRDYLPGEEREVGLFAVRREAIDDFLLEFNQESLPVEMLSVGYLSLFNFVNYDIDPEEPAIVLDIGASHTDLILVDQQRFFIRPLPHSGNDITHAIMQRFKLGFAEAEKLKVQAGKAPQQAAKIFQAVIAPKLRELVQEVHRSIGYYRTQAGEAKFEKLYLFGNGSKVIGIKKFLEEHLSLAVERVQSINHIRLNRDVNVRLLQSDLPAFGAALGAGIQALGIASCNVDLIPKEEKLRKEVQRKRKHPFVACGIVLLLILIAHMMVRGKTEEVEAVRSEARSFYKRHTNAEKEVEELEKFTEERLAQKIKVLKRLGEHRRGGFEGLRVLENVLATLPNATIHEVALTEDKSAQAAIDEAHDQLKGKLWIPYMKVEAIEYPEEEKQTRRRRSRRKKDAVNKVPAYRFTAYVVIKMRQDAKTSIDDISRTFQKQVQRELNHGNLSVLKEVNVKNATPELKAVFHEPGGSDIGADYEQEGRPFFGAEVSWVMLPRMPEKPEPAGKDAESNAGD